MIKRVRTSRLEASARMWFTSRNNVMSDDDEDDDGQRVTEYSVYKQGGQVKETDYARRLSIYTSSAREDGKQLGMNL